MSSSTCNRQANNPSAELWTMINSGLLWLAALIFVHTHRKRVSGQAQHNIMLLTCNHTIAFCWLTTYQLCCKIFWPYSQNELLSLQNTSIREIICTQSRWQPRDSLDVAMYTAHLTWPLPLLTFLTHYSWTSLTTHTSPPHSPHSPLTHTPHLTSLLTHISFTTRTSLHSPHLPLTHLTSLTHITFTTHASLHSPHSPLTHTSPHMPHSHTTPHSITHSPLTHLT